jgi:hypothetical protein
MSVSGSQDNRIERKVTRRRKHLAQITSPTIVTSGFPHQGGRIADGCVAPETPAWLSDQHTIGRLAEYLSHFGPLLFGARFLVVTRKPWCEFAQGRNLKSGFGKGCHVREHDRQRNGERA